MRFAFAHRRTHADSDQSTVAENLDRAIALYATGLLGPSEDRSPDEPLADPTELRATT